jgi:uncharacterized protein YidB (DUF937 family)
MSWFDALKKQVLDALGQSTPASEAPADPAAHAGMFDSVIAMVKEKGLGQLAQQFDAKGMKDVFASWVGKGANLPISTEQLERVFGAESLEALARKLGLPADQAAAILAKVLPKTVDKMTPEGTIEEPPADLPAAEPSSAASF